MLIQNVITPVVIEPATPVVHANPDVSTEKSTPEAVSNSKAHTEETLNSAQLKNAVDQINKTIQSLANNLQFSMERVQGMQVVKVVDNETHKVIRQIPTEEMVEIAKRLDEVQGLLIHQKA